MIEKFRFAEYVGEDAVCMAFWVFCGVVLMIYIAIPYDIGWRDGKIRIWKV